MVLVTATCSRRRPKNYLSPSLGLTVYSIINTVITSPIKSYRWDVAPGDASAPLFSIRSTPKGVPLLILIPCEKMVQIFRMVYETNLGTFCFILTTQIMYYLVCYFRLLSPLHYHESTLYAFYLGEKKFEQPAGFYRPCKTKEASKLIQMGIHIPHVRIMTYLVVLRSFRSFPLSHGRFHCICTSKGILYLRPSRCTCKNWYNSQTYFWDLGFMECRTVVDLFLSITDQWSACFSEVSLLRLLETFYVM